MTTRRRNRWVHNGLGRGLGTVAARFLGLGVLGSGVGILAMSGLPPRGLPAVDLPPAFRILAVALIPTSRLIPASAPFAQADPWAWLAPSGLRALFSRTLAHAHGSLYLPREKPEEDVSASSSGAIKMRTERSLPSLKRSSRTRQRTRRL